MRRSDRAIIDFSEQSALLSKGVLLHMALLDEGRPYIVPMSYGWDGEHTYMHCANKGLKLDCLDADARVALNVVPFLRVLSQSEAKNACDMTTWYESVTVFGMLRRVTDPADRTRGFAAIARQYGVEHLPMQDMPALVLLRVDVERITAKRNLPPTGNAPAQA